MTDNIPSFAHRTEERLRSQSLDIIVMGPGSNSTGGLKRHTIAKAIQDLGSNDQVLFPEDAIEKLEHLKDLSLFEAERLLVSEADAVIVLLVSDITVTGPNTEVAQFLNVPRLRDRFFVIEPVEFKDLFDRGTPYQLSSLKQFDSNRRFAYTSEQFVSCTAIRDRIRQWLSGVRYQKLVQSESI